MIGKRAIHRNRFFAMFMALVMVLALAPGLSLSTSAADANIYYNLQEDTVITGVASGGVMPTSGVLKNAGSPTLTVLGDARKSISVTNRGSDWVTVDIALDRISPALTPGDTYKVSVIGRVAVADSARKKMKLSQSDGAVTITSVEWDNGATDFTLTGTFVYDTSKSSIRIQNEGGTNYDFTIDYIVVAGADATLPENPPLETAEISYTAVADGLVGTPSTKITLTFSESVELLFAADITFTPGTTGATKGMLSGSGTTYELALGGTIATGDVKIAITKDGVDTVVKTVRVYGMTGESKIVTVKVGGATGQYPEYFTTNVSVTTDGPDVPFTLTKEWAADEVAALLDSNGNLNLHTANSTYNFYVDSMIIIANGMPVYDMQEDGNLRSGQTVGTSTVSGHLWINTGATVEVVDNEGAKSLYVSGRANNWNAVGILLARLKAIVADDACTITITGRVEADKTPVPGDEPRWETGLPSLAETYADYFLFGNILEPGILNDPDTLAMFKHQYNAVTAENAMKPSNMVTQVGGELVFNFTNADKLVDWAIENEIPVHGHTLVWHSQSPYFLALTADNKDAAPLTRAQAKANLEEYITNVAGHYAGKVISWDVVNESISGGNNSMWKRAYENGAVGSEEGEDYIYDAFVITRRVDPDAVLYYNDFNEHLNREKIATMINKYNLRWANDMANNPDEAGEYTTVAAYLADGGRLLIEGVGMQAHYWVCEQASLLANVQAAIALYRSIGVRISVSELDIPKDNGDWGPAAASEADKEAQAIMYAQLFQLYIENADIIDRVTLWGRDDGTSWRRGDSNGSASPLIFDSKLKAKPAFWAVIDPDAFLEGIEMPEPFTPPMASAAKGSPELGTDSVLWDDAQAFTVDWQAVGTSSTTAQVRILWDEEYVYVRAEVTDDNIDTTSNNAWEKDSVEVFLSETNYRGGYGSAQGNQYRVDADGGASQKSNVEGWGVAGTGTYSYAEKTDDGYLVEMKLPWRGDTLPAAGTVIGFDIQINDPPPPAGSRPQVTWSDPEAGGYSSSAKWGEVTLTEYVPTYYSVTVTNGTGSGDYLAGDSVTIVADGISGRVFSSWTIDPAVTFTEGSETTPTATFTMPDENVTVTATYTTIPTPPNPPTPPTPPTPGDPGNPSLPINPGTPTNPSNPTEITDPTSPASPEPAPKLVVAVESTVNEDGKASAAVDEEIVAELLEQSGDIASSVVTIVSVLPEGTKPEDINELELEISAAAYDSIGDSGAAGLAVDTALCVVSFDSKAIETIMDSDEGDFVLSINRLSGDDLDLSESDLEKIGDRPVYSFLVTKGDTVVSDFGGGKATVTIPYTLGSNENPDAIVVYYIDADGNLKTVRGYYDSAAGAVVFTTTHFSAYAAAYNPVYFNDVDSSAWYSGAVMFMSARGYTDGIGEGNFGPDGIVTRAQFIKMLYDALGIAPVESGDNFADAGDTWYTGYLAAAKQTGISGGIGDNLFAPDRAVTREEMFTLLYKALVATGEMPAKAGKEIISFQDAGDISDWAYEAMECLVSKGIISGSNGLLAPHGTAVRAEIVQVFRNLLGK